MCGIAGIVGPGVAPEKLAAVARMSVALARRGPDDHGIGSFGSAVLGHRRLAIFDLSENGRQPMTSLDGEVAVVFNGAIYNFHDLREQLRANGSVFSSATDTEVLLHGYQAWGMVEMVKRLRGMFAFALWDIRRRKLFLVRDRLGVKPLAYAVRGRQIAFASTVGALRQGGFAGPLNEESMLDVLRWGFVQEPRAIYRGIVKLAPATILEWCDGNIGQKRYWQAPAAAAASSRVGFSHAVAETERYLLDAVAVRLQADVPVGVLLSGGIDSSLVCWALAQLGADVTAYTIAVPGDASDETRGAIATAQRLRLRHRVIPIAAEGTEPLDEMLAAFDEPFASASALGMLQVSRAVRTQAKVLLTGDGGDDIFLGYPRHRHLWLSEQLSLRLPGLSDLARRLLPRVGPLKRAASLCDYAAGGLPVYFGPTYALAAYRQRNLLGRRFKQNLADIPWSEEFGTQGWVERLANFERRGRFIGEYLRKIDGATMFHGLEARAPFLDQQLWEFASALPVGVRLAGGRLKAPLRAIARRRIGRAIAWRKKRGFTIPVLRWLARQWRGRARELFNDSILARTGWIDGKSVLTELDRAVDRGCAVEPLWNIFVLESWLQREQHLDIHGRGASGETAQAVTAAAGILQ